MTEILKVDIWSDVACPWCFIGKRRFERAAQAFEAETGRRLDIEYHSFELAGDTPVDFAGTEIDFLVEHKGMPVTQVTQMIDQITQLAASEGLAYDFESLQHTNTLKAHQLLHFAKAHGKQQQMKELLLSAYFEQGRHVGRVSDLADLAEEAGLDRASVVEALNSQQYLADVRADQALAQRYGISGVPFYVIGGKYGVSGAQSPETFASALRQAAGLSPGTTSVG